MKNTEKTDRIRQPLSKWITFKNIILLLLAGAILWGAYAAFLPHKRPIFPVVLLINRYPLQEEDKVFLRNINPYGFLLSIPIHPGLKPKELKKELETILGRDDFLFFIDQEGGSVNRLKHFIKGGFQAPAPQSFGKLAKQDSDKAVQEVYQYGLRTGKALKELGIDVVFAPLAEAASAENIHHRSRYFSTDPKIAKMLADAYAQGLDAGGVTPRYKHFPGAATLTDPHATAQTIDISADTLRTQYTGQFAQSGRWNCLMTAHATYPVLDSKNISTFSPAFYRFLRKEIPFEGLVLPDALNMQAAAGSRLESIGARMNKALAAGADVVMPFFPFSSEPKWMEEQIRQIRPPYIKRFQKRAHLLKRRN